MAKNDATPVTTRLSTMSLRRVVDYTQQINTLSSEDQHRIHDGICKFLSIIESTAAVRKQTRSDGLLHRWKDSRSRGIDKVIAASLAMWYALPGNPYRITINFDHKYKAKDFKYLRDELSRQMHKYQIKFYWFSFEVSKSGRLHCHGMANISPVTTLETLRNILKERFGKSSEIRKSLIWGNQIVHIDQVEYAPHQGKGAGILGFLCDG